ncbi:hypothetical protein [Psychrobacter sp. YP14]|uniref:hypothetical protein n=1 Tax=Psychrobacter sp. YP14 TaxID=2203895 RepID=UPI001D0DA7DC|nr:hypothetical protein [Psychrobacter sp. YP14]
MTPVNSRTVSFFARPAAFHPLDYSSYYVSYKRFIKFMLSSSLCFLVMTPAQASPRDPLKMSLTASKVVVDKQGKAHYIQVNTAKVGTVIQYKATFSNTLHTAIQNTTVTLPIPTNTEFTGEVYPPSAQASVDYYNYRDLPLMRMVDGQLVEVPKSEYKSLRWDIKYIPPRKAVNVAFNTIVH